MLRPRSRFLLRLLPVTARAAVTLATCFAAAAIAMPATAATGTWQTDANVGPSEVTYTLTFTCFGPASVCDPLNAYSDTQVSTLVDAATLQIDEVVDTLQFDNDSTQDLDDGMGPIPASLTLEGSDMAFAGIALFGIPEVVDPVVFSTDQPLIPLAGLGLLAPGSYPIATTMSWGGLADVVGDISLLLPQIVVTPTAVSVTGTLEVLGDVDSDGAIEYEIRNLQASTQSTEQYDEPGILVDVHVSADLVANLSGEVAAPAPVPFLAPPALGALAALLGVSGLSGVVRGHRRREQV